MNTKDYLSVPTPLFLFKGGPNARYQLTMSPLERKVIIALAVSGEPEMISELAVATELELEKLEEILADLAAKGIVTLVREPAEEGEEVQLDTANIVEFPRDIIEDRSQETAAPPEPKPDRFAPASLKTYFESLKDQNYYQMLGLGPSAAKSQIRRAYFDLVADYHPDRHRDIEDPQVLAVLSEIFDLLTAAYETLRNKKRRRLYDRTIPQFTGVAESEEEEALSALFEESRAEALAGQPRSEKPLGWNFYQTAVEAFEARDYQTADLNFKLAAGMDPDRPEYQEGLQRAKEIINEKLLEELKREAASLEGKKKFAEAVVTLVKAAELDPVDPKIRFALARLRFLKTMDRLRAEEDISWAVSLDPKNVEALLLMGRIQAWKGNTKAAVSTFRQVLRLVPGHPKAKQALALFEK